MSHPSLDSILTITHQVRLYRALFGGLNRFLSSPLVAQWRLLRSHNLLNTPKEQEDFEKLVSYPDKNIVWLRTANLLNPENETRLLQVDLSSALSSMINLLYRNRLLSEHQQTNFETLALKKERQEDLLNYYLECRASGKSFDNASTLRLFEILTQKPIHELEAE